MIINEQPMIGQIKASETVKIIKEMRNKVKVEKEAVVFSFYSFSSLFMEQKHKITTQIYMNKIPLNSSYCVSDEALGKI